MNDMIFDEYQNCVNYCLIRHNNILDVITKYSETNSKVNRAIAKSITNCGCINIKNISYIKNGENNINKEISSDSKTSCIACDDCREVIEKEIGNNLFYLTSLCNLLGISLYDIIIKEYNKMITLGKFNLLILKKLD